MNDYLKERDKWWPVSPELMASYKDESHTEEWGDGTLTWLKKGEYHRDGDKPAYIGTDGRLAWYKNGLAHRDDDKPAVIGADASLEWYKNGKEHRDVDLPAFIGPDGLLEWWKDGLLHRDDDLPARIEGKSKLMWFKNCLLHRTIGPAVIDKNNNFQWWVNGVDITDEVEPWLKTRQYTYPFTPEQQVEFMLTFS
jgi:hypothetical protein